MKKKIIIIDDEPLIPLLINEFLEEDNGFEISEIVSAPEAFEDAVERNYFDVALIDISVGEWEGGLRLLRVLKDKKIQLPSIILSSHSEGDYALKCLQAGARGYINKLNICSSLLPGLKHVCSGGLYVAGDFGAAIVAQYERAGVGPKQPSKFSRAIQRQTDGVRI